MLPKRLPIQTITIVVSLLMSGSSLLAWEKTFQIDDEGRHQASVELDPYYSTIAYVHSLTKDPIPRESYSKEKYVYFSLLKKIYLPRYLLLEASVYPFPIAGVYIRKNREDFYNDSQLTENINAVKAVSAGFPEPWAFSFFWGNVVDYVKEGEKKISGKGYSGLLFSYGNRHIVDNIMVQDNWYEVELKLKGKDIRQKRDLSWSYALGYKGHNNKEIKDKLYFYFKRTRIDYVDYDVNFLWKFIFHNSELETRVDFDRNRVQKGKIVRYFFLFGKKFVLGESITLSMGGGALKTKASGYTGSLEREVDAQWQLLVRPNLHIKF
jgi:hypothetical protein